jgi:hypothetical protein
MLYEVQLRRLTVGNRSPQSGHGELDYGIGVDGCFRSDDVHCLPPIPAIEVNQRLGRARWGIANRP